MTWLRLATRPRSAAFLFRGLRRSKSLRRALVRSGLRFALALEVARLDATVTLMELGADEEIADHLADSLIEDMGGSVQPHDLHMLVAMYAERGRGDD